MLKNGNVTLRPAIPSDLEPLYAALTGDLSWKQFDAPYFPFTPPSKERFAERFFRRLSAGEIARVIDVDGDPVGSVTYYWENEATRWLEVGIALYAPEHWGKGLGRRALAPWITHLFQTLEIERVGLTTWSGNPRMIACAERTGMQLEARIRKVRYYEGVYYDSIKLGVLREEWRALGYDV